eukprot:4180024-Alexandrium_andersonii.AAC.1
MGLEPKRGFEKTGAVHSEAERAIEEPAPEAKTAHEARATAFPGARPLHKAMGSIETHGPPSKKPGN